MQAARAQVGVARAGYAGARVSSVGNPYMELTGDRTFNGTGGANLAANLWLPLDVWGQRRSRISAVDAQLAYQGTALEATRAQAASEAVMAYGEAVVDAERVKLFEAILAGAQAEAALYRARMAAGDATEQDVGLAQLEVGRNAVALAEAGADLTRALTDLARATGAEAYTAPVDQAAQPAPPGAETLSPADRMAARAPHVLALESEATMYDRSRERWAAEARTPLSLMVITGRSELGDYRLGAGLAITLPVLRKNQGEQAIAEAESSRARLEAGAQRASTRAALRGLLRERKKVRAALDEIATSVEPAGQAAVDAAVAMQKAGKGEMLRVLTARRDLNLLRTRRLELLRREWTIVSQIVALTGALP